MKDLLSGGLMIVLALALVTGAIVYVAGGGDGKWLYETRIVLDATRDESVHWLADPEKRLRWVQGLQESELLDAERAHQGARMREVFRIEGELQERAVEYQKLDPLREIVMISTGPRFIMRETITMTGTPSKTHLLYQAEISQEGLGIMLFEPLFSASINARLRKGLETLQAQLAVSAF